jgi:hypothetical protein
VIQPGRVVPVFLHRDDRHGVHSVQGIIEHAFGYNTQPQVVIDRASDWPASSESPRSRLVVQVSMLGLSAADSAAVGAGR